MAMGEEQSGGGAVDGHRGKRRRRATTPTGNDVGMYLRAWATYEDGHCDPCDTKKTAHAISANPVQADPSNKPPSFLG